MFAPLTAQNDAIFGRPTLYTQWFHHAAAVVCAVTRKDVYVLAPEAVRAMIGIPITFYLLATMFTGEIFDTLLKFGAHITVAKSDAVNAAPAESVQLSVKVSPPRSLDNV